jgi:hypothetical protein
MARAPRGLEIDIKVCTIIDNGDRSRQKSTRVAGRDYGYRYRVAGNDSLDEPFTHLGVDQAVRLQSVLQPRHPRPIGLPQLLAANHAGCCGGYRACAPDDHSAHRSAPATSLELTSS